ncbi:MAG: hypothetical protein EXR77_17090 [Myxococcales bacterium]|nr:hypothetical protein [Myxococcales bacterium]
MKPMSMMPPTRSPFRTLVLVVACALAVASCATNGQPANGGANTTNNTTTGTQAGGDFTCLTPATSDGQIAIQCQARPELSIDATGKKVSNGGLLPMAVGVVKIGADLKVDITIKNTAATTTAAALRIESISIAYDNLAPDETDEKPALDCLNGAGTAKCSKATWKHIVPASFNLGAGQATEEKFAVVYRRYDAKDRTAKVTIKFLNVDSKSGLQTYTFSVKTEQGKPKLELQPADGLLFPYVQPGIADPPKQKFSALNSGDAVLTIGAVKLAEIDPSFTLKLIDPPDFDTEVHVGGKPWVFAKPLELEVGKAAEFEVTFSPKDDKKKGGVAKFDSNDPDNVNRKIQIDGNTSVPCLSMNPTGKYNFGGAVPGMVPGELTVTLKNCGSADLVVTSIDFIKEEKMSNEFAIDLAPLAGKLKAGDTVVRATNPLVLKINEAADFKVKYQPEDITPNDSPADFATIKPKSNAFVTKTLTLEGIGVKETCPIAKVTVQEGEQVVPQTLIHLKGDKSTAPGGGSIKKYKWTVKQPAGSNQPLLPNASFANPTLMANASGEYEFCLDVWDGNDVKSCLTTCQKVLVIPNNALHIELLWDTPADPDQTDSGPAAGADLDLHFAHPLASTLDLDCDGAADPWFSNPWDTFWFNAAPEWGVAGVPKDNPTLDLDDTDGAGPENLNLVDPEGSPDDPVAYSLGVHYWNDHGYGTSYATVSIYIQGGLALQFTKIKLDPLDMWFVGKVNWPNTASGGGKKVFDTCYQSGLSCPAKKNLMWQPKGDWCITKCYVNKVFNGTVGNAFAGKCQ